MTVLMDIQKNLLKISKAAKLVEISTGLKSAMKGCSTLYNVAAYYSLWDRNKKLIYDINVQGTRNILETALELGLERVVYTSTVGCIGLSDNRTPTNEDNTLDPITLSNDYFLEKGSLILILVNRVLLHPYSLTNL